MKEAVSNFLMYLVLLSIGYWTGQANPIVKEEPKSIKCFEYIPPCNEEITFNTDVPDKCWIEED